MNRAGFSLLEVMVATLVLAIAGAALTRSFVVTSEVTVRLDRIRRAELLAIQAIEASRIGHAVEALPAGGPWERRVLESSPTPLLRHVSVVVEHRNDANVSVELEALAWRP